MPAKIFSATLFGLDAKIVEVEVDVHSGLPCTVIVGHADSSIRESKERVRACLRNSADFSYPLARISINLAPADIYKYGTQCDLAIALGILAASGQLNANFSGMLVLGELSLDGKVRPVNGVLAMVVAAKQQGILNIILSSENLSEARLVQGVSLFGCESLEQAIAAACHDPGLSNKYQPAILFSEQVSNYCDFSEILGQSFAKRGLEIAAAGQHNLRMVGSPGSGKTMLAQAFVSILPRPSNSQLLEIIKIHSVRGLVQGQTFGNVPFRNPHQSISENAFVGGGKIIYPGEISLAHNGVLFLDEFPEFPRRIIESLREPLESGSIKISRVQGNYIFPANFILIAAQNPCPCGNYFERNACVCSAGEVLRYGRRISGPILDRIDIQIQVPRVSSIFSSEDQECSERVLQRVKRARQIQYQRLGSDRFNSKMNRAEINRFCKISVNSQRLLGAAQQKFKFSMRTYFRMLKVARTIADLAESPEVSEQHLAESLQFRLGD